MPAGQLVETVPQLRFPLPGDPPLCQADRNNTKAKTVSTPSTLINSSFVGQELTFKEEFIFCDPKMYSRKLSKDEGTGQIPRVFECAAGWLWQCTFIAEVWRSENMSSGCCHIRFW